MDNVADISHFLSGNKGHGFDSYIIVVFHPIIWAVVQV